MLKEVEYPKHLWRGILPLKGGGFKAENVVVFGGDTETVRGEPDTVQICGPDDEVIYQVNDQNIFQEFWGWTRARARRDAFNIVYFHNLNFDLRVLFKLWHLKMYEQYNKIEFEVDGGIEVSMLFGRVNTATIKQGKTKVHLYDTKAFTQAGLARSLKMFKVPSLKMKPPPGLGQKPILLLPGGKEYAMQDARAVRQLGLRIIDFHAAYDVSKPCITLPSYAARVFRTKFLGLDEKIPFPPKAVVKAAELSYHGGKNGHYLKEPEVLEDVYEVDISSAYPHAMVELPPMTEGDYISVNDFVEGYEGVYCISGVTGSDLYPTVFDHAFRKLKPNTPFKDIWITSYEYRAVKELSDVTITSVHGHVWMPGKDSRNPFARYVKHFYDKKQSASKDDPFYQFFKICLNGLYGKLCATQEVVSVEAKKELKKLRDAGVDIPADIVLDERFDSVLGKYVSIKRKWQAGSMYNPFWASLITGHTRAYLYRLEKKLNAVHAATDSVKSMEPHEKVKGLGGLNVECWGRAYLFRNKLYLHCSKDSEYCGHKEPPYTYPDDHPTKPGKPLVDSDGQHLCKVALHGFKGRVWELWDARNKLIRNKELVYKYTHVVGLREGMKRKETVCDFVKRKERLTL